MGAFRKLLKWMTTLSVLTLIQEKPTNIYGAAICSPPCLLFSNLTDIVALDYKTSAAHSVVSGLKRAVAIDVHFSLGYIFWSDVWERNIKRSGIDGSGTTIIISNIGVCDGLAVEWRTSKLYWTDTTHDTISVSDLAGKNPRKLLSSGLYKPRDIALDPDNGLMIWTDWGSAPKIEKATLSGKQRVAIVTSNLKWPNGIELDRGNKRLFWVDAGVDRVESVDYHGHNRKLLKRVTGFHPFGVALIAPFLFLTDWATRSPIHKLDAGTGDYVISSYSRSGWPMGIVAYDSARQPPVSSPCAVNNGGCSHFCVVKTSGYSCVCSAGLALKKDGRTCEEKVKKFLLFTDAVGKSTNIISLDANYFVAMTLFRHLGNQRPIALDYDPVEDRVYWTDVRQGLVISAFSNASSLKILFRCNVGVPDGLAIDKVGRNIYWTDTGTNRIEVARLDGTMRKLLIKDGLDEPRAIVLDERNGMMYWTDWGSNPKIEQAAMDGSLRRSIVTGNLGWPNGLTIDQTTNLLYWADARLDTIEVSDLNGGKRRKILSSAANIHPFGLTVYQGILYWTDWIHKSISRFDVSNGNTEMIITGLKKPMDIHLYDASLPGSHPCSTNNGLCSDLCLLKPQGGYQCACPTGIALKPDGKNCDYDMFYDKSSDKFMLFAEANTGEIYKVPLAVPDTPCQPLAIKTNISRPVAVDYDPVEGKVYWTDVTLEQVARAFPNGSDVEVLAKNVINPDGVAVDWIGRNLYWTDAGTNKIEVSRLDGSSRTSLVTVNVGLPRAIILDIEARKMYWSDWGASKIEKANMDGTARTIIVSSGLAWVNSLALDFKNDLLYWCDARLDKIERVDLQGNNRVVILDLSSGGRYHPFGLALYEDVLFWTDWITKSVHKYNITSTISEVLVDGMGRPMEIHIYDHKTLATGTTSCSHLNGGCSHICLPNPTGHRCFCPEGVQLKPGDPFTCQGVNRCPQLSAPAHGSLLPCPNLPGQTCQFSCDKGYLLKGASTRTCKNDGTWTGLQTQCTVVTCPALPAPSNGVRKGCTGTITERHNTVCHFSCSVGFNGMGSTTRTCLVNGSWSGQDFVCQAITCPPLVTPPKTILLTPSCSSTYGSSCLYSCQTGYTSLTGNVTRTCLSSGQWSGSAIICTDSTPPTFGASCPGGQLLVYAERDKFSALVNWNKPVAIDNSGVAPTVTSNYQPPHRFSQGSHVITYTAVDQSGNKATCSFTVKVIVINCTSLMVDPGGPLRMSSCGRHYGSKCSFSCAVGYRLNGSSTVTCVAPGNRPPGKWDNSVPVCQVISCPSLVTPPTAVLLTPSCSSTYGSSCLYSCRTGYTSSTGNVTRTCLSSGQWSGNDISCKDSTPPTFGATCPRGPLLAYTERDKFSALVNWTEPVAIDNSGITPTVTSNYQSPRRFSQGSHVITYTAVDQAGNKAACSFTVKVIVINCTSLMVDPGGPLRMRNCSNHYGSKCNFSCAAGYRLNGSSTVTCVAPGNRPPGKWDHPVPVCKVISCPLLVTPPKAILLTPSCSSTYGSNCLYSCQTGYTSSTGNVTRTCLSSGRWSGNDISCKDSTPPTFGATCPGGPLLAYAERDKFSALVNWTEPVATDNSGVAPTVTSNYHLPQRFGQGSHVITYIAVDQSGNKATCAFTVNVVVINCTSLKVDLSGPLRMSSCGNYYGSKCNFSCKIGYRLNGSSTVTCVAPGNRPPGKWDSRMPVCQVISCPLLVTPPKAIRLTPSCSSTYGSSCLYSCQTGYTSSTGNVSRTCLSSGQWSGNDINCTDSTPPTFGVLCPGGPLLVYAEREKFSALVNWTEPVAIDNSGITPTVTSNYQPPQRFSQGSHVITYTAVDQSGNKATCTYVVKVVVINCTLLMVVPGGPLRMSSCGNHYGSKCNFSCVIGHRLNGSSTVTCVAPGNRPPGFWDNALPTCEVINCLPLDTPPRATMLTVPCNSTYGSNCSFSCQTGYTSLSGNVTRTCLSSGQWSGNDINCTDSTPPTFGATCPGGPLLAYAERDKFSALVNWTEPVAIDNSGIAPTVTSNYQPLQRFSQGSHVITYTAVDQSGNEATCNLTIRVIVIHCTSLMVHPGGPLLISSCNSHYGSKCNFSCVIGHRLNGSSTVTCVARGNRPPGFWDNALPTCEVIKCLPLDTPPKAILLTVPCNITYGSNCSFSCQTGYTSSSGNVTRTCLSSGQWSGKDIDCTDSTPPTFGVSCPRGPLLAYAERDMFSALVNWTEPVAIDNSGIAPTVTFNYQPPQRFSQGSHVITYTAADQSGNEATCNLTIRVIVIHCTSLMVHPGGPLLISSCSSHYGSKCNFSCVIGHRLNGSSTVTCVARGNRPPGFWDNALPKCEVIKCLPLDTPPKATLLTVPCNITYGSNCSFSCQTGYTSSSGNVTRTCLSSGQWSEKDIDCTDSTPPTFGVSCPGGPLLSYAERDMFSALVNWTEPVAIDNSGIAPTVTSNYQPPQRFSQGSHVITYTAVDQSGNKATCNLTMRVTVINCRSVIVDPRSPLRIGTCGTHYGSKCNFSCAIGYRLNGSSTIICVAPGNRPPGFWDNPLPVCEAIMCPSLPSPPNGLKTGCTDPLSERYGTVCSFSCNVGYNLTGSSKRQCQENETWSGLTSSCLVINCSALAPPLNAAVSPSSCLSRSTYGQTCRFYCPKAGYVLQGTSARVCGNDGEWSGANDTLCKDNKLPSFNTCPRNMVVYVPKCSSNALVNWNEPVATDNSGHVTISYPAVRPPANLSIGLHNIHYSATDDEGNRANCSFIVQVTRTSCPVLQPPIYGTISSLSCGSYFGSQASISCNQGYGLTGSRVRSCETDGKWSGNETKCKIIACPPLVTPPRATLLTIPCTNMYGSNCSFSCQTGYASSTGSVTRRCLSSGQWSGNDINCTDVQPPSFGVTCPGGPLLAYAERDKFSALVNWTRPVAIDNSGLAPTVTSDYQPPQRFSQGSHVITYAAVDQSGNKATCTFTVKVIVINCTSVTVDPGGPLRMSSCGNNYGSKCNFSCTVGYRLNGSATVTCVASGNRPPGKWDNPAPVCQAIMCPSLPSPSNGVKTGCTDPLSERYGTVCSFACNVGYNLTGSSRRQCLKNEKWSGLGSSCQVINCSALVPPPNAAISPLSCLSRSTYGQACRFSCQRGYVLKGTTLRVCGNDGVWTGNNDTLCRDNKPPSFNDTCPRNMVVYVPKCSSNVLVNWTEPPATDNSGHVTISYPSMRPPANLTIGLYNVHYSATDDEGNKANCSFIVQVAKKSCPVLRHPLYGAITSLSCGWSFGSQASLSCNQGYRLAGSRVRSCKADGKWSGTATLCNIVKCPAIKVPSHGTVYPASCKIPSGVNYKTDCFFTCNASNNYQLEGSPRVSCLENGSWSSDVSRVICKDIQPPSIQCPSHMEVSTEPGQSYANVTWRVPVPTDNSNEPLNLSGLLPPQQLNVGRTNITYDVRDSAGLSSSCLFSILVKDLEKPMIVPCPEDIKIISTQRWHKLVLPAVTVTDNVGVNLFTTTPKNGSEVTWGEYEITYSAYDKAANTEYCRFLFTIAESSCVDLAPPENGAKVCETWWPELRCTTHCNKEYALAFHPDPVYVCTLMNSKWEWRNFKVPWRKGTKLALPDCSKRYEPFGAWFYGWHHFLTNKCGGQDMNEKIADRYIQLPLSSTSDWFACRNNPDCKIENFKVDCGEQSPDQTRQRRDTTAKIPLTVSFDLKVPLVNYSNLSHDLNQTLLKMLNDILATLDKADISWNISGVNIQNNPSRPPEVRLLRFICAEGQVQSEAACVNCPVGYFLNGTSCQACAVDHYQDQEAQSSCMVCPPGTSTFGRQASKRQQDCQELPNHKSEETKQGLSKPIRISVITAGTVLLVVLIAVVIWRARKYCLGQAGKMDSDSYPVGFSNQAYDDSDWAEVKLRDLMDSYEA